QPKAINRGQADPDDEERDGQRPADRGCAGPVAGLGAVRLGSAGICEAFSMARRAEPAARLCTTPLSKAGSLTCPHTCSTGNLRHDSAPALAEPGEVLPLPGSCP